MLSELELKGIMGLAMWVFEGRTFHVEKTGNADALRKKHVRHKWGSEEAGFLEYKERIVGIAIRRTWGGQIMKDVVDDYVDMDCTMNKYPLPRDNVN